MAFGTDAALVLSELQSLVHDENPADVLFYSSHPPDPGPPKATFRARFVGYDGAVAGKAKATWVKYRPDSTATDSDWTGFYLVRDLRRLEVPITIAALRKRGKRAKLSKTFLPRGPLLIDTPF